VISIRDDVPHDETVAKIQSVVDGYPGLSAICSHTSRGRSKRCSPVGRLDCRARLRSRLAVLRSKAKEVES